MTMTDERVPMTDLAPIAVALDAPDLATARDWAVAVAPYVSTLKVGLEVYLRDGRAGVEAIREAAPHRDLFLDLKLHDIPATVAGAARSVASLAPTYLTVHASGGAAVVAAAAEALPDTLIAGVTVLTSLSDADLAVFGDATASDLALRLAEVAVNAGARALVCSPHEVRRIRHVAGDDIVLITPGVRPLGAGRDDQSRVATPQAAVADGADLLVIGRPITGADDIGSAARDIAASISVVA